MAKKLDASIINKAISSSIPLTIKTYKLPHEMELYIEKILGIYLEKFGQSELKDRISYCMRELAVNAKKANTKRVYFAERNLDINDPEDYSIGMLNFKDDTMNNIDFWLEKQKNAGLYIKIVFHSTTEFLNLYIKNNIKLSSKEALRIQDRIARAKKIESLEEGMASIMDNSEGAGLGIVILVLMLKKIGLNENAFSINVINNETVAKLRIPFDKVHIENLNELTKTIVEEIDELPQFPENVVSIQKLVEDPDSELLDIARHISLDPSLTADLLKIVNSAQYMMSQRVDNIFEAVKILGLRGLRNMLLSCGTQKILQTTQKHLWEHSQRVAFYSYNLAKNFKKKREIHDDAYVGGILHDIGKIVFSNVHPNLLEKISNFCNEKGFQRDIMEELTAGLNHAVIGGKIGEKWQFPESLISIVTYHHNPKQAPKEYSELVNIVYTASAMADCQSGDMSFEQIYVDILIKVGIKNKEQFFSISESLSTAFNNANFSFI